MKKAYTTEEKNLRKMIDKHGAEKLREAARLAAPDHNIVAVTQKFDITPSQAMAMIAAGRSLLAEDARRQEQAEMRQKLAIAKEEAKREEREAVKAKLAADRAEIADKVRRMGENNAPLYPMCRALNEQLGSALARIEEFRERLLVDTAYAMAWSLDAFHDAASIGVLQRILSYKVLETMDVEEAKKIIASIREDLLNTVKHRAKYPPRSTSPVSNLVEQEEAAVYADLHENLEWELHSIERKQQKEEV